MSNRTVCGCAVNTAGRAMRAWFKRWRREFNVYGLPRLEPVKLGALAQLIGWRVTNAHCIEFAAFEALQKHVRATKDPALKALVSDYFAAVKETEATASAVQMLERAELDYLRGVVWPHGEHQNQVLPDACEHLYRQKWFDE